MTLSKILVTGWFIACQALSQAGGPLRAALEVPYAGEQSDQEQRLDIYRPDSDQRDLPVHVYVHGGAWTMGDKSALRSEYINAYTDRGIMLVSLNYRLAPAHTFPANSQDIVTASHWIRENIQRYGGDPENMVLSGHSAGAHLVALFAVGSIEAPAQDSSDFFRAILAVDTAAYDLTQAESEGLFTRFLRRQKRKTFGTRESVLRRASPQHQIEREGQYSKLFLYATAERKSAVRSTYAFKEALEQHGHEATVTIVPDLSHRQMNRALFTPEHSIFGDVLALFR